MFETAGLANSTASPTALLGDAVDVNPVADWFEGWMGSYLGIRGAASDIIAAALVLAIFIVLSWVAKRFVTDVAPRLVSKTNTSLDDEILKAVKDPVQVLFIAAGAYLACKTLNGLSLGIIAAMDTLASIALILICAYFVANLIGAIIKWYVADVAPKTGSDLDDRLMPFLQKFLVAAVYVIAVIMIINMFVEITPLIAGLGIFGVAIAFAAKEALSSLFGAFAIIGDRPFRLGDRLYLDGIGNGEVVDVGMRSTRIRTTDNRIVIAPNQSLAVSRIVNWSKPDTKVRLELKVGIGYRSDADKACAILERIASGTPGVSKDPKPRAYVSELGDFAVVITLLVYVDTFKSEWIVPDTIYRGALETFKKEGIEIPFPTMTVMPKPQ